MKLTHRGQSEKWCQNTRNFEDLKFYQKPLTKDWNPSEHRLCYSRQHRFIYYTPKLQLAIDRRLLYKLNHVVNDPPLHILGQSVFVPGACASPSGDTRGDVERS